MWIEEMFGGMKKHGFNLENSLLCHFIRLSQLTMDEHQNQYHPHGTEKSV